MPVRLKITLLFSILFLFILVIVCGSVFYFFQNSRKISNQNRLVGRAISVGRLITQREYFSNELIQKIDASRSFVMKNNVVGAFDKYDRLIYRYTSLAGDSLNYNSKLLAKARLNGMVHFKSHNKEIVAYYYRSPRQDLVIITGGEDDEGAQLSHKLVRILLITFFLGITLSAIGAYYFSKMLLHPLNKIADDVKNISAFNLSRRLPTGKAEDEWNHLSSVVNDLLDRLQESFDIQKRFIANASHELSTPLTSISNQIEVSLQRERTAPDYKHVMQSVYNDVVHLTNLTQTLLQFAKASGTASGLEIELIRIDEILMQIPAEMVRINRDFTVNLQFINLPADEKKLLVFGNEDLLLIAVKNMVANACKYAQNHCSEVRLMVENGFIKISIVDTGIGIPHDELEKIFQPFYRVADFSTAEGFGLGLPLASRIVSLHKGFLDVQSEPGHGTTFEITLPEAEGFMTKGKTL